jgi:hypothetical protein
MVTWGRSPPLGVDLVDCSSGGLLPHVTIPFGPGYQTAFAQRIKKEARILTGAVGMIIAAEQVERAAATGILSLSLRALGDDGAKSALPDQHKPATDTAVSDTMTVIGYGVPHSAGGDQGD